MISTTAQMKSKQSLRYGTRAHDTGVGRVLYWSSRAIALLFHHRVITLLNRYGVLLPSAIIVDTDLFPRITSGYFQDEQIILDSLSIDLSHPIDLSLHRRANPPIDDTLDAIRPFLKVKSHSIATAVLRIDGESSKLSGIEKAVSERQFTILEQSRTPEIAVKRLLGLGFALTPSGDDFALGVISTMNLLGKDTTSLYQSINEYDYPLSRTILLDALDEYYSEPLYHFIDSLSHGIPSTKILSKLLETGHSSGSDILAGVYYTLSRQV